MIEKALMGTLMLSLEEMLSRWDARALCRDLKAIILARTGLPRPRFSLARSLARFSLPCQWENHVDDNTGRIGMIGRCEPNARGESVSGSRASPNVR